MSFILSAESTIDMPWPYAEERDIPILHYHYSIDMDEYEDDMGKDPEQRAGFYRAILEDKKIPKTTQLNEAEYEAFFSALLEKGDVLHLAFGSGMTNSVFNAFRAQETMKEKYPDRKLVVIDTLCSQGGFGLLADAAADLRDEGRSLDEVADWVENNKLSVNHQFTQTDIQYFKRSGRMSGPTAAIATILNICPNMHLDDQGKIVAYDKVRGRKAAIQETVRAMEDHAKDRNGYSGKCYIGHANCPDSAQEAL